MRTPILLAAVILLGGPVVIHSARLLIRQKVRFTITPNHFQFAVNKSGQYAETSWPRNAVFEVRCAGAGQQLQCRLKSEKPVILISGDKRTLAQIEAAIQSAMERIPETLNADGETQLPGIANSPASAGVAIDGSITLRDEIEIKKTPEGLSLIIPGAGNTFLATGDLMNLLFITCLCFYVWVGYLVVHAYKIQYKQLLFPWVFSLIATFWILQWLLKRGRRNLPMILEINRDHVSIDNPAMVRRKHRVLRNKVRDIFLKSTYSEDSKSKMIVCLKATGIPTIRFCQHRDLTEMKRVIWAVRKELNMPPPEF